MGAISGGVEQDAGTRYPTEFRDPQGNRLFARYMRGVGAGHDGSSARLFEVEDIRAFFDPHTNRASTYLFTWDTSVPTSPKLSQITNTISTAETYTFGIVGGKPLSSPFSPSVSFGTTNQLQSLTNGLNQQTSFQYTAGDTLELERVVLPAGGYIRWIHGAFTFSNSRTYREVTDRYLASMSTSTEQHYSFNRDPSDSGRSSHYWADVHDDSAPAQHAWYFQMTSGPYFGLLLTDEQRILFNAGTLSRRDFAYNLDAAGNPYANYVSMRLDPNTAQEMASSTLIAKDGHGNVTQRVERSWVSPNWITQRTYDYTYVTDTAYTNQDKWNLLLTATVTPGGQTQGTVIVTNTYDGTPEGFSGAAICTAVYSGHSWTTPPSPVGNITKIVSPGKVANFRYSNTGTAVESNDGQSHEVQACLDSTFSAPTAIKPQNNANLQTSVTYTTALAPSNITEPNSAVTSITYDGTARPTQSTSKLGAQTTYTYSISPPWTMATVNGRWTKTWTDSFGRTIKVETGIGAPSNLATKSIQETKYGACGCNPLGKVSGVSLPYAPGATPAWTTYQYDARGRTTSVTLPDNSATTHTYSGYSTTITDAAGKWKTQVVDVLGNLVQLIEPDPAGGANLVTTYTYDHFDRLVQVSMPRGATTQTRTWTYDPTTLRLSSTSNPESGTTSYTWNTDGSLQKRTDARGMTVNFAYDSYGRITSKTPRWANGTEDTPNKVIYYYDSYTDSYVQNAQGRLAATKKYGNGNVVEMYSYNNSGTVSAKRLNLYSPYNLDLGGPLVYTMQMTYYYDNEGRVTGEGTVPQGATDVTYTYDTMGRPYTGPSLGGVTYGPANEPKTVYFPTIETREYNTLGQLTRQVSSSSGTTLYDFQYTFPAAGSNNGRITKFKDAAPGSGEEVNYTYDALNRLTKAETVNSPGWGQAFGYDGFGNLISETVTKNTAPVFNLTVDGATNHILNSGYSYDAAGNMTNNGYYTYNPESKTTGINGAPVSYGADGRRLLSGDMTENTTTTIYFRDPWGRLRQTATYYVDSLHAEQFNITNRYDWVMGTPMTRGSNDRPVRDRLGNSRVIVTRNPSTGFSTVTARNSIRPYSDLGVSTGRWVFGTYEQGSSADYADQRWYKNDVGRFTTPDPYQLSGGPRDPGSWNRYAYVGGDPVNRSDPSGLDPYCGPNRVWDGEGCLLGAGGSDPIYDASLPTDLDQGCIADPGFNWVSSGTNPCGPSVFESGPEEAASPIDPCPGIAKKIWNAITGVGMPNGKSLLVRVVEQITGDPAKFESHQIQIDNTRNRLKDLRREWKRANCDDPDDPPYGTNRWISETNGRTLSKLSGDYRQGLDYLTVFAVSYSAYAFSQAAIALGEIGAFVELLPVIP